METRLFKKANWLMVLFPDLSSPADAHLVSIKKWTAASTSRLFSSFSFFHSITFFCSRHIKKREIPEVVAFMVRKSCIRWGLSKKKKQHKNTPILRHLNVILPGWIIYYMGGGINILNKWFAHIILFAVVSVAVTLIISADRFIADHPAHVFSSFTLWEGDMMLAALL